jgi:hypothetical protein
MVRTVNAAWEQSLRRFDPYLWSQILLGMGTAWCGRLPVTQDTQEGSLPFILANKFMGC